jgi:hypothetical protein
MTITRKPSPTASADVDVDVLINRGGSVAKLERKPADSKKQVYVQLRLQHDIIERIDDSLRARDIKTPRHTWLLEAIHEKLEREGITSQ